MNKEGLKEDLIRKLKKQNSFWSYNMNAISGIPDRNVISGTILHLDMDDIVLLFKAYPKSLIRKVWREDIALQGDHYKNLNHLMATVFFDIKMPKRYMKIIYTNHNKKLQKLWKA